MAVYLTRLADICRAADLDVVEVRGWKTRGHGPMTAVKTVVCHHTAGARRGNMPSLNVVTNGRPGLPGPLCHLGLGRDGTVYAVAAGLAYHAGQVRNASYANAYSIGIEAEATGVDEWPRAQWEAYARLCAALVDAYDLAVSRVLAHKEICFPVGRKTDPNFSMAPFRARVAKILAAPATAEIAAPTTLHSAVWSRDRMKGDFSSAGNPTWAPSTVLTRTYAMTIDALTATGRARTAMSATAVDAATAASGAAAVVAATTTAGRSALALVGNITEGRAAGRRAEATVDAVVESTTTSLAKAVRAAVDASTVRVRVDIRPAGPGADVRRTAAVDAVRDPGQEAGLGTGRPAAGTGRPAADSR